MTRRLQPVLLAAFIAAPAAAIASTAWRTLARAVGMAVHITATAPLVSGAVPTRAAGFAFGSAAARDTAAHASAGSTT